MSELVRGHSPLQMTHFILERNGVTPYGAYVQALREIETRRRSIASLKFERERLEIETDRLRNRWCLSSRSRRRRDLELRKTLFALSECRRSLRTSARELSHFLQEARRLRATLGPLNAARRESLDRQTWCAKLRMMMALDLLCLGRIDRTTAELLTVLPQSLRAPLIAAISSESSRAALVKGLLEESKDS